MSMKARTSAAEPPGSSSLDGTARRIDRYITDLNDWRGERIAAIRAMIKEADPGVTEDWKWKGTPVWSHDGMYVHANAFKDKVKVTFLHGAHLEDPHGLFNNGLGGSKWRAIDLREDDSLDGRKFRALVKEAVSYNRTHSVPRSRKTNA